MTTSIQSPVVSVIIVSWNARAHLEQCLATLTERACRYPMEIIVVDNDSTDGSPESVERCFPHVVLIRKDQNLGFSRANNIGIARSTGRYICLINSDVKVRKDCITRLVDYCETHPAVGMVGPRIMGGDGRLQRSCRGFPSLGNIFCRALALDTFFPKIRFFCGYALWYWPQETEAEVDILSGCFWLLRRKALDEVGLLDEAFFIYGEDLDWCMRFWAAGWKLTFVPSGEAIHYGGASSSNAPVRFYVEQQRADLQYWRKHHSRLATACYFLIALLHQVVRVVGHTLTLCLSGKDYPSHLHKVRRSIACIKWMIVLPRRRRSEGCTSENSLSSRGHDSAVLEKISD